MDIHVFERVPQGGKVLGWDGQRDPSSLHRSVRWPATELDTPVDDGDYRMVVYSVDGEASIPRINIPALPVLEGLGAAVTAGVVVVDVDLPGHRQWRDLAEATAHIDGLLSTAPEGSLLYSAAFYTTRAGYRLLWLLEHAIPVTQYRSLLTHVMRVLRDEHGIECDPTCAEWNRLYRMPRCMRDGSLLDSYSDLVPLSEPLLNPFQWGALEHDRGIAAEVAGDAPEPLDSMTLEQWKGAWRHPYLRKALPFPPDDSGSTYRSMRRAIASVAHEGSVTDPELLFSLVVGSVDATPERTRQEAWKMCVWTASKQRGAQAKPPPPPPVRPLNPDRIPTDTWVDWSRTLDRRHASTLNRLQAGLPFTPKTQAQDKLLSALWGMAFKLQLTDTEILFRAFYPSAMASSVDPTFVWEQCARVVGQVEAEKQQLVSDDTKMAAVYCADTPLLIAVPGAGGLYMLDVRNAAPTYQLTDKTCLTLHYDQWLADRLPFDASFLDENGKPVPVDALLRSYGNSATTIRYVTGQRGAAFAPDHDGNALEIGVHSIHPDLRPVFHPQVDEWLRLFGGSDPERFLDWLAVATMTRFPVCALYVHGLPGSGKSMLLQGLASMWGGAPVPFSNVAADFNASLLDSPIISADEGIPADKGDLSETFRNLVANSVHDVRIKYQANATLHACLRLVITANEMDALDFRKTLSGRSLQAIVERVLYLDQDDAPVEYLKKLGGRAATAHWAQRSPGTPGLIGEHLLWLRENRQVTSDGRFLVEGRMTRWHRQFIDQQGIKPDAIKVVAMAAKGAARLHGHQAVAGVELRRDLGCVFITKEAVVSYWSSQGRTDVPRERLLNKTLAQLDERDRIGLARPRIGRGNASAGQRAYVVSFQTLTNSQYVTMAVLEGSSNPGGEE